MGMKSVSASMASKIISMCIVPIKVTHAETKREVSTFAMLDNVSQGCFIKNNIRESDRKTEIIIKTLSGDQEVASVVISGLRVASDMEGVRQHWLNLPAAYTREGLPADVEEVATMLQDGSSLTLSVWIIGPMSHSVSVDGPLFQPSV